MSLARCFFAFKEEFKCCSVLLALSFNDSRIESSGSGLDDPTNRAHISALNHSSLISDFTVHVGDSPGTKIRMKNCVGFLWSYTARTLFMQLKVFTLILNLCIAKA